MVTAVGEGYLEKKGGIVGEESTVEGGGGGGEQEGNPWKFEVLREEKRAWRPNPLLRPIQ